MRFQVKMVENARKNIFTDKQRTKKVPPKILDLKVLTKNVTIPILDSVNKERRYGVCI